MTLERKIGNLFRMNEETWQRHANPWSVYTRFSILALLVAAFWSRVWLGWWSAIAVAVVLAWTWYNPRFFTKPKSTNNWASKAVFGERVWLNRDKVPVPGHHRILPNVLSGINGCGALFVIWGLAILDGWMTLFGMAMIYLGKTWFLDRMVWLYEDMKDTSTEYLNWLYENDTKQ
jgi:hypothetical protein